MDALMFDKKTVGSDARYVPFTGEGHFELIDIFTEPGQGPQAWVTVLDENGRFLPGVEVQNWFPNSESGRGEVFPSRYPYTEFNFGVGNKYLTHQAEPPDHIRIYNQASDEVWCGVPDGVHFRWTMIFQLRKSSPIPPPSNGAGEASRYLLDRLSRAFKVTSEDLARLE